MEHEHPVPMAPFEVVQVMVEAIFACRHLRIGSFAQLLGDVFALGGNISFVIEHSLMTETWRIAEILS